MNHEKLDQKLPFISVIMPIRNEERHIAEALSSLQKQTYPVGRFEVIIVDGMSDDRTREIIDKLKTHSPSVQLLDNPGKIVPTAMNIGLRAARGDIIVRVDGHAIVAPDYLEQCVATLSRVDAACVGGRIESINDTFIGRVIADAMSSPFGVGNSAFRTSEGEGYVDTLAFGAYPRWVFANIGLFDEELVRCQDDEFNYRLRKSGGKIYLTQRIRSRYYPRTNLKKLLKQFLQYGYWKVRVLQKHPNMMQPRQFVPPCFVLSFLTAGVLAPFWPAMATIATAILGLYTLASFSVSALVGSKRGLQYFVVLPLVFAILHFGYGAGFLFGLVKFATRWRATRVFQEIPS